MATGDIWKRVTAVIVNFNSNSELETWFRLETHRQSPVIPWDGAPWEEKVNFVRNIRAWKYRFCSTWEASLPDPLACKGKGDLHMSLPFLPSSFLPIIRSWEDGTLMCHSGLIPNGLYPLSTWIIRVCVQFLFLSLVFSTWKTIFTESEREWANHNCQYPKAGVHFVSESLLTLLIYPEILCRG